MLTPLPPSAGAIAEFVATQGRLDLTYAAAGMTRGEPPPGFSKDHRRTKLGQGPDVFERAAAALRAWEMFRVGWVRLETCGRPPDVGTVAAVIVCLGPLWWANACRVVYAIDETRPVRRLGFAYGTLPGHAECGEERFLVEMDAHGDVWYDLLAYSRPRHWLAWLAYPLTRALQRQFARASSRAMERAVGHPSE